MGRSFGPLVAAILSPKVLRYLAYAAPYLVFTALVGVILVGAWMIFDIRREAREQPDSTDDLLARFKEARASGEMDEAEYRRVTAILRGQPGPQAGEAEAADRPRSDVPPPAPKLEGEPPFPSSGRGEDESDASGQP